MHPAHIQRLEFFYNNITDMFVASEIIESIMDDDFQCEMNMLYILVECEQAEFKELRKALSTYLYVNQLETY